MNNLRKQLQQRASEQKTDRKINSHNETVTIHTHIYTYSRSRLLHCNHTTTEQGTQQTDRDACTCLTFVVLSVHFTKQKTNNIAQSTKSCQPVSLI